ncbi:Phage shock protein B [Vibrio nigripulchritudo MADA3029]|uniref:Phage shock protein B n=2 Tax=Vibrio nigripulchritudo TaxID=28173 RepID=U4K4I6_9VIBR|nr:MULTISPECIES: envelope stress response membrane protein PspB [Vibrio]EGU52873.1 phage shock protein B [Vibrio nigripulchritudo ATCC 27043]KJY79809.1 phage-shock protein [Vibrio nigripulchritudo]UAB71791.1 envelope stress response membrane protein PspB [Vibrio sp. SCSIO 43132]CCN33982.1 Phage shock protein B [Vibrio nigripulchritudo AM115]CCN41091.1 Phage shock protein B [Vibrio nigripulchritudo FTn2]
MSAAFITAPLIVFLIFVAPIWLVLHYRSKRKTAQGLSDEDFEKLQSLTRQAEAMQQRVQTLERILDAESPNWRQNL